MYLRHSRRNSPSLAMRSFINFFFVAPLPLSYRQTKFHISAVNRSLGAATGGVL